LFESLEERRGEGKVWSVGNIRKMVKTFTFLILRIL